MFTDFFLPISDKVSQMAQLSTDFYLIVFYESDTPSRLAWNASVGSVTLVEPPGKSSDSADVLTSVFEPRIPAERPVPEDPKGFC